MFKMKKFILYFSIMLNTLLATSIIIVLINPSIIVTFEEMVSKERVSHMEHASTTLNTINREKNEKNIPLFIDNFHAFPLFEHTIEEGEEDIPVITNPTSELLVINRERRLPPGFEPPDLVIPDVLFSFSEEHEKRYLREEAARALEEMFSAAEEENIHLFAVSGYRSYDRQVFLYDYYTGTMGEEEAARASAYPGTSEHQSGLAMDISSESNGFQLSKEFGETQEGKWVKDKAHEFGFIIRYAEDKEEITGYKYEPWHLRYVGVDAATYLKENDLTLEESYGKRF